MKDKTGTHVIQYGEDTIEIFYRAKPNNIIELDDRAWLYGHENEPGQAIDLEDHIPCWFTLSDIRDRIALIEEGMRDGY